MGGPSSCGQERSTRHGVSPYPLDGLVLIPTSSRQPARTAGPKRCWREERLQEASEGGPLNLPLCGGRWAVSDSERRVPTSAWRSGWGAVQTQYRKLPLTQRSLRPMPDAQDHDALVFDPVAEGQTTTNSRRLPLTGRPRSEKSARLSAVATRRVAKRAAAEGLNCPM